MKLIEPIECCKICFKELKNNTFHSLFNNIEICNSCMMKMNPYFKTFYIDNTKALAIYRYDDFIKQLIYQFKGCFDIELKNVFLGPYRFELSLLFYSYYLVPLPSSKEHDEKRGFNHVVESFKCLKLPFLNVLYKNKNHKQSEGNIFQRKDVSNVIEIKNGELIKCKKILIVDDICTTGSSLRRAIELVKKYEPKELKILVIAKRDLTEQEKEYVKGKIEII